jgi:hypothetical protein
MIIDDGVRTLRQVASHPSLSFLIAENPRDTSLNQGLLPKILSGLLETGEKRCDLYPCTVNIPYGRELAIN